MKRTGHTTLDVPIDRVDLADWLFTLTDAEYQAAAPPPTAPPAPSSKTAYAAPSTSKPSADT